MVTRVLTCPSMAGLTEEYLEQQLARDDREAVSL